MGQAKPLTQRQSSNKPVFYLLAGPNGAGKSTLYKALVQVGTIPDTAEFVNADLYEAEHLQHITGHKHAQNKRACGPMPAVHHCYRLVDLLLAKPSFRIHPNWC